MITEADDHLLDRDAIGELRLDTGTTLASWMQVQLDIRTRVSVSGGRCARRSSHSGSEPFFEGNGMSR